MDSLISFLCKVFSLLGKTTSDILQGISFLYRSAVNLMTVTEEYTEYFVCPKCNLLHSYDDCLEVEANGQEWSKCCEFVEFPNHIVRTRWAESSKIFNNLRLQYRMDSILGSFCSASRSAKNILKALHSNWRNWSYYAKKFCHTFSMGAAAFEAYVCGVMPALNMNDFVTTYLRGWDTFCRK